MRNARSKEQSFDKLRIGGFGSDFAQFALIADAELEPRYRDHALKGKWLGYRDLHIEPDWLLL